MRSLLEDALTAVDAHVGGPARARVRRSDLRSDDELILTLDPDHDDGLWFSFVNGRLRELQPTKDRKVPLARTELSRRARVLSYRPGRRLVLEVVETGGTRILKGYRARRSERAALLHRIACQAASAAGFSVPPLLEHRGDVEALCFERASGEPFTFERPETMQALGRQLRTFQRTEPAPELDEHSALDELSVLDTWASRVRTITSELPIGWRATRNALGALPLPRERRVNTHRDLHDGQLMLGRNGLTLLDFDLMTLADPALDPCNLLSHLELRQLQGRVTSSAARALRNAFLDGFGPLEEDDVPSSRFYQATARLRLALVYAIRPRWSSLSTSLVTLARSGLGLSPIAQER